MIVMNNIQMPEVNVTMPEINVKNEIQMPEVNVDHVPGGPLPNLSPKGKVSQLQGNRMAVSIFFDEYKNQAAGLEAIRGDAENFKSVLED